MQPPSEIGMIGDTLLVRAGDEVSAFYGRLADGIGITADQMAIVFRIHQDAKWNDGVPITSEDVVYTYTALKELIQGSLYYEFIDSIEVLDNRHVVFRLSSPLTIFNIIMIRYTPILPAHYWRERDPTASTMEIPVTSGPYQMTNVNCCWFAQVMIGRYVEYKRDPDYWGRDIPVNRGLCGTKEMIRRHDAL